MKAGRTLFDVLVIGAGPAGLLAALRAADLGASTALITRGEFGGMAANDGPVPVRTLAHAARLIRDARQLGRYGIAVSEPVLDYPRLLARVREVVDDVRAHSAFARADRGRGRHRPRAGRRRALHRIRTRSKPRAGCDCRPRQIILCTGGVSRRLSVPGFELTATHSDAWRLTSVPPSMLVIGGGATGAQVASIFNAFGSRVAALPGGPAHPADRGRRRLGGRRGCLPQNRASWCTRASAPSILSRRRRAACGWSSRKTAHGARAEAALAVVAVGWIANTAGLNLATAGVETDRRGFVRVDAHLRTSAPHIFAAGDVTGRLMLVPQAMQEGFVAATNAVRGADDDAGGPGEPDRQLHRPRVCAGGPDRGEGA